MLSVFTPPISILDGSASKLSISMEDLIVQLYGIVSVSSLSGTH